LSRRLGITLGLASLVAAWVTLGGGWDFLIRSYREVIHLYQNHSELRQLLKEWGWLAPAVFIGIQALQVILSPIPGEATGLLGGFLFGLGPGFLYSTIGLTLGTVAAFGVGRWLGAKIIRRLIADHIWEKLGFVIEAEGAILAFVLFLIPGFPKDILSYLFGLSPMPFWIFTVASTLGRIPGTWWLSAQGANVATGDFRMLALLVAVLAAVVIPIYYYRNRIIKRFHNQPADPPPDDQQAKKLDGEKA
jgi:uncharacterized membrane protein YdjX (TVP38/TMEM64 family)